MGFDFVCRALHRHGKNKTPRQQRLGFNMRMIQKFWNFFKYSLKGPKKKNS